MCLFNSLAIYRYLYDLSALTDRCLQRDGRILLCLALLVLIVLESMMGRRHLIWFTRMVTSNPSFFLPQTIDRQLRARVDYTRYCKTSRYTKSARAVTMIRCYVVVDELPH